MVLSAHFDHVGTVGNNIFRGALDNGSGTTSLLYLTKKLKEYSDNNGLENDIIIAGFNGEEANLQGSKAFAKKIKNQYEKIYNINVDCIGYSKDTDLMIAGTYDVNKELIEAFSDALKDDFVWRNIPNEEAKSDNLSFENQGISAIEITQDGLKEVIHTLKDTVDVIDVDKLIKISYKVFDFVINNDGVIYDFDVEAYNA